ncbi:MAG: hypothetical protein LBN07_01335 [Christensenellaceae bacterium]|nr:hypothetical protein [Christensenellaceae bacterium]
MRVVFVEGRKATGKTTLSNIMAKGGNALYFDVAPTYNKARQGNWELHSRAAMVLYPGAYLLKKFTYETFCEDIKEQVLSSNADICIISGVRSMYGIDYITDYFNFAEQKIIYLDTDLDTARQAYLTRKDANKDKSKLGFEASFMYESVLGIEKIKEHVLKNSENCLYCYREDKNYKIIQDAVKFAYDGQAEVSMEEINNYFNNNSSLSTEKEALNANQAKGAVE